MCEAYTYTALSRFLTYVTIDTQSDASSLTQPSTMKQKDLGRLLVRELLELGLADAHLDEHGYVYATLPSNSAKKVPVICFCSHMDTSPDSSGTGVKPLVHKNYQGQDLVLPDDITQVIKLSEHPALKEQLGNDIVTASGTTLLGADNKAGLAEIMDAVHYLVKHPEVKHGTVKILFTPDEEIGRGVNKVDIKKLGADFGYTMDGETAGNVEDQTFSADGMKVIFHGISAHPGFAKEKMISAIKLAGKLVDRLPMDLSPEGTEGMEGFVHPTGINGTIERAEVNFIIRDFVTAKLADHENFIKSLANKIIAENNGSSVEFEITEQYRNMKEVLDKYPHVMEYALEAVNKTGLVAKRTSIRGGTDGSRLSFMGLPCPNIFAGEHAFHSKHEWVSVQDMQKAVDTIVNLVQIWEQKS
ncbi:MAG TPA: peptidase T [Flavobacteriales bacterium]|nr:peptidase T [Flavobacteriales bacterium]